MCIKWDNTLVQIKLLIVLTTCSNFETIVLTNIGFGQHLGTPCHVLVMSTPGKVYFVVTHKENPFYCSLLSHGTPVHQMFFCDISDVDRAFPSGQDQNQIEEKNKEKNEEKWEKLQGNEERLRKCSYLAHPGVRGWLQPCVTFISIFYGHICYFNSSKTSYVVWNIGIINLICFLEILPILKSPGHVVLFSLCWICWRCIDLM